MLEFVRTRPLIFSALVISGALLAKSSSGGFFGLGASTSTTTSSSASHSMMSRAPSGDMMKHPTALFGLGHCNCAVPTCPSCGTGASELGQPPRGVGFHHKKSNPYGEDTHNSPEAMMGLPSSIKRRVMINTIGDEGGYSNPRVAHLFGHNSAPMVSSAEAEILAGAGGWL